MIKDKKRMLLHACCAPCASHVLEELMPEYDVTLFYYNPNISPIDEYMKRGEALQTLLTKMGTISFVSALKSDYDDAEVVKNALMPYCDDAEGGQRCHVCYELRLKETVKQASVGGYDIFTTTLSVSPHKKATVINEIGKKLSSEFDVPYLEADFKKKDGYKRSVEISRQHDIYRQNYCGCDWSKQ